MAQTSTAGALEKLGEGRGMEFWGGRGHFWAGRLKGLERGRAEEGGTEKTMSQHGLLGHGYGDQPDKVLESRPNF